VGLGLARTKPHRLKPVLLKKQLPLKIQGQLECFEIAGLKLIAGNLLGNRFGRPVSVGFGVADRHGSYRRRCTLNIRQ